MKSFHDDGTAIDDNQHVSRTFSSLVWTYSNQQRVKLPCNLSIVNLTKHGRMEKPSVTLHRAY